MNPDDPTASNIFVPTDADYAVDVLRRLFGDTVSSLMGDQGATTGGAILTTVIGTFNIAVLFFATVVAAYLMYQLFLDTARDGEAGGRDNNLAVTSLRAAGGAALLLPVKGGFSVVQLLVLQLLLWGSGLGDYVWKTVAVEMQTTATYTASTADRGDSFITAKKMAGVLATRTAGHLCRLHANKISDTLGTGDNAVIARGPETISRPIFGDDGTRYDSSEVWYFGAQPQYNARNEICGSTKLVFAAPPTSKTVDTDIYGTDMTFGQALTEMTNDTVRINGVAAVTELDTTAKDIAQRIFNGERNTDNLKSTIRTAVTTATRNFISGMNSSVTSSPEASQLATLKNSFLGATTDNGWMFAATWQRALAAYVTKLNSARNQLSFVNSTEMDPKASATSIWGAITGYSNTEERLFQAVDSDFDYLKTFDGTFVEAGEPNPSNLTTLEKVAANNQEQSSILSMQWIYSMMFDASKTPDASNQWNDPLVEIQELGQSAILAGGVTIAGSAAMETVGTGLAIATAATGNILAAAGSMAAAYVGDMIGYFGYALLLLGIILAIMLPFLPFVYFLSGAIGWVIMAIEAVVAAPIWILLTFAPHRSGDIIGTNKQGLLLMVGVFFRPVLMIIGLLACFLVMRVGLDFVNVMFTGIYMILAPDFDVSNLFLAFGLIGMYVLTLIALVANSCALITGLGDAVMEFIGVRVGILGQNSIAQSTEMALNPMGRAAGGMEKSVTQMGARTRALGSSTTDNPNAGSRKIGGDLTRFISRRPTGNGGQAG